MNLPVSTRHSPLAIHWWCFQACEVALCEGLGQPEWQIHTCVFAQLYGSCSIKEQHMLIGAFAFLWGGNSTKEQNPNTHV